MGKKFDVKFNEKKILNAVKAKSQEAALKKGVQITCKKCGSKFLMNAESGFCPNCGTKYKLAFDT